MHSKEKILKFINKQKIGLEIGPSHNPAAPKKDGYNVHIVDHLSKSDLIRHYEKANVNLEAIEDVDFIWSGQSYKELTGKSKYYDYIIASHVIEHVPDFISFLNDCEEVLKDSGVLSLVVPDIRFCFDYFRPITGLSKIIDAYILKNKLPTPGTVAEHLLYTVKNSGNITWNSFPLKDNYSFLHSLEQAKDKMNEVIKNNSYFDSHCWCFTPSSFRLLISDLYELGFIKYKEISYYPTEGYEFYITLSKNGRSSSLNRLDFLQKIKTEQSDTDTSIKLVLATKNNFNEEGYLLANPDVAKAVKSGLIDSGFFHFMKFGKLEKRLIRILY